MTEFVPLNERLYKPLGPKSEDLIKRVNSTLATNYDPYKFCVDKTSGPWMIDADENKALDFLSGYSSVLTHRNEDVIRALEKEMRYGSDLVSRAVYTSKLAEFGELVNEATGYDRVLPKSDGGSATDSAISGLLMHGYEMGINNPEVILTENYFHGRPWIFASNAKFDSDQSFRRNPRAQGVVVVKDNVQEIAKAINKNTVGLFIETHKGEGGPLFSTKEHYMAIRWLAKDMGLFLGCDEIQTGLGRCGYMMAWQEFGEEARPDFVTLGKALGGGIYPVSAVVGTEEFMRVYIPGSDGSTWGGNSLACAAACASLNYIMEKDIPGKAKELGDYLASKMEGIKGVKTEHKGLLMRIDVKGIETTKYACLEMLLGENRNPRVFMKHGHNDPEKNVAYTRIAPPIGAISKELINRAVKKTIKPVLIDAQK